MTQEEDFYSRLTSILDKENSIPGEFTYKFIIPTDTKKIGQIQKVFDGANPSFSMKESKNGKYTSITVQIFAMDAQTVVHYYKEVSKLEGVIML